MIESTLRNMKYILILVILIYSLSAFSQEVKLKQNKYQRSKNIKESYYVLKKNRKCKNGEYLFYYPNQILKIEGGFKNNLKHGKWIYYETNGKIKEVQHYAEGLQTGIWERHIESGQVIKRFDKANKQELESLVNIEIHYPKKARELGIEGDVEIQFSLDDNCNILKYQIIRSVGGGCDKEIIEKINRLFRLSAKYNIPIEFCEQETFTQKYSFKLLD